MTSVYSDLDRLARSVLTFNRIPVSVLVKLLELMTRYGNSDAALVLGVYLLSGEWIDFDGCLVEDSDKRILRRRRGRKNLDKAEKFLSRAWRMGRRDSAYYLAELYLAKKQYSKSCYWCLRSLPYISREQRACCYHALGYMYYNFNSTKNSYGRALDYWRKAAKLGSAKAMYELGVVHLYGEHVKKDHERGREYLNRCCLLDPSMINAVRSILSEYERDVQRSVRDTKPLFNGV